MATRITNEQAMQKLRDMKANAVASQFMRGVLIGAAGAYMFAGVITERQYTEITEPELQPA